MADIPGLSRDGRGEPKPPLAPEARSRSRPRLPSWTWAYVAFRVGDGLSSALIPLAIVLHYNKEAWVLALATAAQNLASVPATFVWAGLMERGIRRRPVVVTGFAIAGASLLVMSTLPAFPVFVGAAVLYTAFGTATSPAASTMVLQKVPRHRWTRTTGALSRRTGFSYLLGMGLSILIAQPPTFWMHLAPGEYLIARGLVGEPHFAGQFAVAALMSGVAAVVAARRIPHYQPPLPHDPGFDPKLIQAGQRRFERPVFFLGRIRSRPTLAGIRNALGSQHRLWPLGYTLTFMGSVCFFASYTGILRHELLLPAGLVLLAQAPSNIVTPITYPWAGRLGARGGETLGVLQGAVLRTATLPLLCIAVAGIGASAYWFILVLHGIMGLSFALLQVNGPVILASVHPHGRAAGVGTYHAAVGLGTLLGSLAAFALLRAYDYRVSYAFSVAIATGGCLLLVRAHRRSQAEAKALGAAPTVAGP